MTSAPVTTEQLVTTVVESTAGGPLDRLATAVTVAAELAQRGDELVDHFVAEARNHGCSWAQIGERLGVTRQAAQQRFVAPQAERRRAGMFQHLDDRARTVVTEAQEAARCLAHNYVGTEHLLLGLLADRNGEAAKVLRGLGVNEDAVQAMVVEIIGRGQTLPAGAIPFTPRAKVVLQLTVDEAKAMGEEQAGSGHMLLALLREGEGVAVQVLVRLGLTIPAVCERLSTIFGRPVSIDGPRPGRRRRRRRT